MQLSQEQPAWWAKVFLWNHLDHPDVEKVLVINRKPCGVTHPKLTEILHTDFLDLSPVADKLTGYNACFFCLGVSSVGMKEDVYYSMTYTLTMHMAEILSKQNPDMTFCYVSGAGTDSTEKGRINWARVKGKTENDLMKLPFQKGLCISSGIHVSRKRSKKCSRIFWCIQSSLPCSQGFIPPICDNTERSGNCDDQLCKIWVRKTDY